MRRRTKEDTRHAWKQCASTAATEEMTVESLLSARPFTLTYENNVLTSVKRP